MVDKKICHFLFIYSLYTKNAGKFLGSVRVIFTDRYSDTFQPRRSTRTILNGFFRISCRIPTNPGHDTLYQAASGRIGSPGRIRSPGSIRPSGRVQLLSSASPCPSGTPGSAASNRFNPDHGVQLLQRVQLLQTDHPVQLLSAASGSYKGLRLNNNNKIMLLGN